MGNRLADLLNRNRQQRKPARRLAGLGGWLLLSAAIQAWAADAPATAPSASEQGAALQLAAHIAHASFSDDRSAKLALLTDYEAVYGSVDKVPTRWPALVRRTLVCQQLANRVCVRSSLEALQGQGGIDGLALNHLFEVSRFGMTVAAIRERLLDASDEAASKVAEPTVTATKLAAKARQSVKPEADSAPAAPATSGAAVVSTDPPPAAGSAPAADSPAHPAKKPRTLAERANARLQRLGGDGDAGYFLDALFIAVAGGLILLFLLYLSARGRRAERLGRLQALQEVQRLEDLRAEEKIKTDHDLWSEQLKSEVAAEAQKAHAEEVLRTVRTAADDALAAELLRFQMEQEEASTAFSAELRRLQEALRAEQSKNEDVFKAAKSRADQAIDAYDQMAARELVYAHKQNDDLQEALHAEREVRKVLEAKVADAMQQVDNYKRHEQTLNDAIAALQRGRAADTRVATEKLKAAQQVAAALQNSLAAMRALNADLERRAEEVAQQSVQRAVVAEPHSENHSDQAVPPGAQRSH